MHGTALPVLIRPALLGLHLLAVAAVVLTVVMGLWQLGVYDAQRHDEQVEQSAAGAVPLDDVLGSDEAFTGDANHRLVSVAGTFAPADRQVWVSGRDLDGRDGYWLVAPFLVGAVDDSGDDSGGGRTDALLVVRGWAAESGTPPPPPATRNIEAILQPTEESGRPLSADRITDTVAIPQLANELPYNLYGGFGVQADPAPRQGLVTVPPPDPDVSWTVGLRNLVYAVQWWVFGVFAIFLWLRMCRDLVRERADAGEPE